MSGCSSSSCSSGGCGSTPACAPANEPAVLPLLQIDRGGRQPSRTVDVTRAFRSTAAYPHGLVVGLDVGSTTVKFVVVDAASDQVLLQDYQRHETRQAEKVLEMLLVIERAFSAVPREAFRVFTTGSGGAAAGRHIGARFVQEVNAVSLAIEHLIPDAQSVVELGGQDAKIIVFKAIGQSGAKKKLPSMNDKCAGGTGAVIDKIRAKLRIPGERLADMRYEGIRLHPVAGKCGVFAETDVNGLQKQGVAAEELMASLFDSIVLQNLSVLTRGHTLRPRVVLLGGPNTYIRGLQECWRHHIPLMWAERNVPVPAEPIEQLITVPDNAQYFAALGAVRFGLAEAADNPGAGLYAGTEALQHYLEVGRIEETRAAGSASLVRGEQELARFRRRFQPEPWIPPALVAGSVVEGFLGLDGGSTSTKAVLLDRDKQVIAKAYQLSKGNPIEDAVEVLRDLEAQITRQGARLEVAGVGTTGYAKDILKDVIGANVALVETVAHTESGLHFYPGTHVIVNVGGQDIKLIVLKNGRVKDFKLNTQCSAGNGYFLQATAASFGVDVRHYADQAFSAERMPTFGYGCAVFMQSDIVDFQRQGWAPHEILAGLAAVLPKNIWLYVGQVPNLATLGTRFVLQGGTQHNLAAVKAQVDFIESRFQGSGVVPEVIVHRHCGEAGAIGCALEAHRVVTQQRRRTSFIGLDRVQQIAFRTTRDESTRCYFCKNKCLRTFIDVRAGTPEAVPVPAESLRPASRVPLQPGERRLIVATCEKGTVEDVRDMRRIKQASDSVAKANPNLMHAAAHDVFAAVNVGDARDAAAGRKRRWTLRSVTSQQDLQRLRESRDRVRIGIPRVLNMYSHAPFFTGFFQSLGVPHANLVFSDYTTDELYRQGARRGSIDPCFPSKLGIPHVHNLLTVHHARQPLTHIFFPMVDSFPTFLTHTQDRRACPTVVATPEAVHAAFVKEGDVFRDHGIVFKKTFLNLDRPALCARQMFDDWGDVLGLSREEADRATDEGLSALTAFERSLRERSRAELDRLEREDRLGIVVLGRPYHNDPGVNHEICDELQKLGYPIFYEDALPVDDDVLERLFGDEVRSGLVDGPMSLGDVWKNSYSENTNRKIWAAKFTARHPNLVALELSSFKCGHDAPIYSVIESIIERSGTPYFSFKDLDENKPAGAIKIRVETIAYFLERYREATAEQRVKRAAIETQVAAFAARLRASMSSSLTAEEWCGASHGR